MMEFMQLPPSKNVDAYLENMIVDNRNERQSATKKSAMPEEIKQQILAITGSIISCNVNKSLVIHLSTFNVINSKTKEWKRK